MFDYDVTMKSEIKLYLETLVMPERLYIIFSFFPNKTLQYGC